MKIVSVLKSMQFRLILVAVVATGTIAFFGSGQSFAQEKRATGTFAVVNGQRVNISVGDVLGQGQDLGDGICSVPDFDLIGQMDKDSLDFNSTIASASEAGAPGLHINAWRRCTRSSRAAGVLAVIKGLPMASVWYALFGITLPALAEVPNIPRETRHRARWSAIPSIVVGGSKTTFLRPSSSRN